MTNRKTAKADILQGTLDLMLLQTLASLGPSHGYAIAARLEQVSGGALLLNMGTLYPALMRRRAARIRYRGMESHRKQPPGAVLSDHRGRPATAGRGEGGMGSHGFYYSRGRR